MRLKPSEAQLFNRYLADQSCLESTFEFTRDGQTEVRRSYHFVFTVAELRRMLAGAGLSVAALYGGPNGEPYSMGSPWLILVAEKDR